MVLCTAINQPCGSSNLVQLCAPQHALQDDRTIIQSHIQTGCRGVAAACGPCVPCECPCMPVAYRLCTTLDNASSKRPVLTAASPFGKAPVRYAALHFFLCGVKATVASRQAAIVSLQRPFFPFRGASPRSFLLNILRACRSSIRNPRSLISSHRSFAFKLQMLEYMKASDLWELMNDSGLKLTDLHVLKQLTRMQAKQSSPYRPCLGSC